MGCVFLESMNEKQFLNKRQLDSRDFHSESPVRPIHSGESLHLACHVVEHTDPLTNQSMRRLLTEPRDPPALPLPSH